MPLMRISLRAGKPAAYKAAVIEATYQAMRTAWSITEHDRFAVISEHDATMFINLVEFKAENRSFGNGIAQYVKP